MIRPKITVKKDDSTNYKALMSRLKGLKKCYVTIGFHDDAGEYDDGTSVVEVALWNEFGTDKTPSRSFIRSTIDENMSKINKWREEALENIIYKGWSAQKALEMIGFRIQVLIQNKIKSNVQPANAPSTQAHKAREGVPQRTLIETELMLRSVTYKVVMA